MIFLLVAVASVVATPLIAAIVVAIASHREDAAQSLSGSPPGRLTSAARLLLTGRLVSRRTAVGRTTVGRTTVGRTGFRRAGLRGPRRPDRTQGLPNLPDLDHATRPAHHLPDLDRATRPAHHLPDLDRATRPAHHLPELDRPDRTRERLTPPPGWQPPGPRPSMDDSMPARNEPTLTRPRS